MYRTHCFHAAIALAATLCASGATAQSSEQNRSLYSVNQPVVQRTDYVIDLAAQGYGLAQEERARLLDWLDSLQLSYGDRLFVDGGNDPDLGRADVARIAAEYGMMLSRGAPMTAGAVQPGTFRVIVSRTEATVPGCPNWDNAKGPSGTSPNYGCGVNSNLAAMVADPNDLVLGQAGSVTGDAATAAKAIGAYRSAAPTGTQGLKDSITKGGK